MFSSTSFAEWKKIGENVSGDTWYVDFERIRKHDGYVYYWNLSDYLKPGKQGHLSVKAYIQGDCKLFRFKPLSFSFHNEPMGGGISTTSNPKKKILRYPSPNSMSEAVLKLVWESVK